MFERDWVGWASLLSFCCSLHVFRLLYVRLVQGHIRRLPGGVPAEGGREEIGLEKT